MDYHGLIKKITDKFSWFTSEFLGEVPKGSYPTEKARVGPWVHSLFEEALAYRDAKFAESKDDRFGYESPTAFWDALKQLEAGNHWEVFGHRTTGQGNEWKSEVVDDETADQIRARVANLTANWHDVQISPNVANINEILDQERKATGWGHTVRTIVKRMCHYGDVWTRSELDRTQDVRGLACEYVCLPGTVLLSPHSHDKWDSWHIIHPQMITGQDIERFFPDFDTKGISEVNDVMNDVTTESYSGGYKHTKLYPMLEVFFDDPKLVDIEFSEEEFALRVKALLEGAEVPVLPEDNHGAYVEHWNAYAAERYQILADLEAKGEEVTPEDKQRLSDILEAIDLINDKHLREERARGVRVGKTKKYPYGRHVVTIDGKVVVDEPSKYEFDYRKLFNHFYNEEVPDRQDGRSDVEILWMLNKRLDQARSRFADVAILNANAKPWFSINDRKLLEEHPEFASNDPTKPGFYSANPPAFPKAPMAAEFLQEIQMEKESASKKLGITSVALGATPTKNASGDLVQTLLSQSQTLISGEANQNLGDGIEDLIEVRLLIMRQFYIEPRIYLIGGVQKVLTLSEHLATVEVEEGGQTQPKEIQGFEVTVRPQSNFPGRWERDTAIISNLVMQMGGAQTPQGQALGEMLLDMMGERFPALARNGEYRKMSEFIAIGQRAVAQQQMQQQMIAQQRAEEGKALEDANKQFQKEALKQQVQGAPQ